MKLTKAKAKELSLKKWEYIVGNDGIIDDGLYLAVPELVKLGWNCGFCARYECTSCPLYINELVCVDPGHPWHTWENDMTVENAQIILDLIKKS